MIFPFSNFIEKHINNIFRFFWMSLSIPLSVISKTADRNPLTTTTTPTKLLVQHIITTALIVSNSNNAFIWKEWGQLVFNFMKWYPCKIPSSEKSFIFQHYEMSIYSIRKCKKTMNDEFFFFWYISIENRIVSFARYLYHLWDKKFCK